MPVHNFVYSRNTEIELDNGRYEFRYWPNGYAADPMFSELQRNWKLTDCEKRTDIYLQSQRSQTVLVKLRNGTQLEIKQLQRFADPLQYWRLVYSENFPIGRDDCAILSSALSTGPLPPSQSFHSPAHLLADLSERRTKVAPINVEKVRALFQRSSCRAEYTHVHVRNSSYVSVAFEDEDPYHLIHVLDFLGLSASRNIHYGDFLNAVTRQPRLIPVQAVN